MRKSQGPGLDHVPGQRLGIAVAKGWMSVQLSLMSGKRCMYALKTSREPLRFLRRTTRQLQQSPLDMLLMLII